ncbi:TIGR03619 family F420-dependent LLM class oxidoreductase [Pseudonocardia dioxanivorans]|jgi:probable F420-dependent oxidoreductase|uniref:TIGR03619 family F420-dependent LLM class oxidoreductase n=1 Tax=Pseudonocardia dioxanivorans TaxID=240495 RepID=UPI000D029232|nr:TIGR03619 family F420-dependent LLM class oxidoreductase [Pseudonocardia dioxanivorans]
MSKPDRPQAPGFGLFSPIVYPINRQDWEDRATPDEIVGVAQAAERCGFDYVTCGDHGVIPAVDLEAYGSGRFFDPIATLGYLAAATSRIGLATFVYQVHLRSPFVTAKSLATLDLLSGGRVIAGFGVGSRRVEAEVAGVDFDSRGKIADEYITAIRRLWTSDVVAFRGRHVAFEDVVCAPRPVQQPHPPIWVAGKRAVSLRRAVRLGDAWVMAPWAVTRDEAAGLLARVRDGADWAARTTPMRVVAAIAPLGGRAPRGLPPTPIARPDDVATERAIEAIERWREIGATDFVVDLPAGSAGMLRDAIEWFGSQVAARLRGATGPTAAPHHAARGCVAESR